MAKLDVLDITIQYHDKVNNQKVALRLTGKPNFDVDNPPAKGTETTVSITPDFSMEPPVDVTTPDPTGFIQYMIGVLANFSQADEAEVEVVEPPAEDEKS